MSCLNGTTASTKGVEGAARMTENSVISVRRNAAQGGTERLSHRVQFCASFGCCREENWSAVL